MMRQMRRDAAMRGGMVAAAMAAAAMAGCEAQRALEPPVAPMMQTVADRVLDDFPEPPPFDWGEGVLMAGMMRAGLVLDEPRYVDFVKAWADHWRQQGLTAVLEGRPDARNRRYCGHWGPGYPVLLLHEKTGNEAYLDMTRQIADFIMTRATRTSDGGLGHWGDNHQLWVDTLYMVGPPFAHLSRLTGDERYLQEAVRQIDIYQRHTQDEETGLFWHMYDDEQKQRVGTLWARGNGWVAMTYVMVLAQLDPDSPAFERLHRDFTRQMDALLRVQDRDSMLWHTVLDHSETYLETSSTAMILSSLVEARRLGLYEPKDPGVIPRTWTALAAKVDEDGHVFDVSGGTMPTAVEEYAAKVRGTYTWGTGAFLLAAAALEESRGASVAPASRR